MHIQKKKKNLFSNWVSEGGFEGKRCQRNFDKETTTCNSPSIHR